MKGLCAFFWQCLTSATYLEKGMDSVLEVLTAGNCRVRLVWGEGGVKGRVGRTEGLEKSAVFGQSVHQSFVFETLQQENNSHQRK